MIHFARLKRGRNGAGTAEYGGFDWRFHWLALA
jgi:hypothetical protein